MFKTHTYNLVIPKLTCLRGGDDGEKFTGCSNQTHVRLVVGREGDENRDETLVCYQTLSVFY